MLSVSHLSVAFGSRVILSDISLSIQKGTTVGLVGPNGSGKTTLFNAISGFLHPRSGKIALENQDITALPPHKINRLGVSRTFQDLRLAMNLPAIENVMLAKANADEQWWNSMTLGLESRERVRRANAIETLTIAGIHEQAQQLAGNLSYGQQKLLTLACCIANDASMLLLDEPVAGVNPAFRTKLVSVMQEQHRKGRTMLVIEHDFDFLASTCDMIIELREGRVVEYTSIDHWRSERLKPFQV